MSKLSTVKFLLACLCVVSGAMVSAAFGRNGAPGVEPDTVGLVELPKQAIQTYVLIHQGGPFASEKDGVTFGNRERLLPAKKRGYYLEYTVPTPGLSHRGVKRIVCGGARITPDVCYYSADHYASFRKIAR
jgi:ribonuclease T1